VAPDVLAAGWLPKARKGWKIGGVQFQSFHQ